MLIEKSISYDSIKLPITFRGATLELSIRPLDADALDECREKATVYRFAENPQTGRQELGAIVTATALDLEMFDFMIADFKGVGFAKDKPWPVNKETKSKLVYLKPGPEDTLPLWKTVLDASKDLAKQRHAALEEEIKNS